MGSELFYVFLSSRERERERESVCVLFLERERRGVVMRLVQVGLVCPMHIDDDNSESTLAV